MSSTINFLGIDFWNDSPSALLAKLWHEGGQLVVPAAPALADIYEDPYYAHCVRNAEFAVIDSILVAWCVSLWKLKIPWRISGLRLTQQLLLHSEQNPIQTKKLLWVVPTIREKDAIKTLIAKEGFREELQAFYEAPFYNTDASFADKSLFDDVRSNKYDAVIVCIGGGKQEKLGYELLKSLETKIPVFCIGAAISFLSGTQASIPTWADRAGLGWLYRIAANPRVFGKRYLRAAWKFPAMLVRSRFDTAAN